MTHQYTNYGPPVTVGHSLFHNGPVCKNITGEIEERREVMAKMVTVLNSQISITRKILLRIRGYKNCVHCLKHLEANKRQAHLVTTTPTHPHIHQPVLGPRPRSSTQKGITGEFLSIDL